LIYAEGVNDQNTLVAALLRYVASSRVLVFLRSFSSTPKAFANFSPGLSLRSNPGTTALLGINAESVGKLANSFRVEKRIPVPFPGLSLRSNPGLKLANAFGVNENF
jgi:hypothetical protein